MKCFWLWPVWCLLPSFLLKETLFLTVRSIRCFTFRPLLFRFSSKSFCNDVNVMYSWRERSSWIYFGSDLFGVFCIPVFDESLTFPVSTCCFACCPVAFVFLSLGEAFVILVRIVRSFAAQPLLFRCSSMSSSTLSNLYLDDEVEAHRVIFADYLWILHSQFLIIFANRDRNFRCFARQLLAFRCPSMSFPTMSTWCFDDEIENQEMILELTCWMAFVFLFFGEAFVILVRKFRFFAVQRLLFRCSSMSFPTMSTWCFDDGIEAHELILALTCLWFEIFLFCLSIVDFSMFLSSFWTSSTW